MSRKMLPPASLSYAAWYTHPIWIAIGIIVLLGVVVLISLAGRHNNTSAGQ